MSQEEMGDRIGARRESVTSELGKMKRQGLLHVETKRVVILDVEALRGVLVF